MGMLCFLTGTATANERLEQRTLFKKNPTTMECVSGVL